MKPPRRSLNWELWREALAYLVNPNGTLKDVLGKWKEPPQDEYVLHSENKDMVFVRHHQVWKAHKRKVQRTSRRQGLGCYTILVDILHNGSATEFWTKPIPEDSQRATVERQQRDFQLLSHGDHSQVPELDKPRTFSEHIDQKPIKDQWLIDQLDVPPNEGEYLAQAMQDHTATAVSDGSCKKETNTATSAFLIEGADKERYCLMGVNQIPGRLASLSSCKAELGGTAGVSSVIEALCMPHKIVKGSIKIRLDNEAAKDYSATNKPPAGEVPSRDLIMMIWEKKRTSQ